MTAIIFDEIQNLTGGNPESQDRVPIIIGDGKISLSDNVHADKYVAIFARVAIGHVHLFDADIIP